MPDHNSLMQRSREIVRTEEQLPGRGSRKIEETGRNTIKEYQRICPDALRQYLVNASEAELSKGAVSAGLKPELRKGIICFTSQAQHQITSDQVFVPIAIRVSLIQRMPVGTQAGHVGYKRTLTKLRQSIFGGAWQLIDRE